MRVSEPEKKEEEAKLDDKVGIDFNQNTEEKELKDISVNTNAKVMN